MDKTHTHKKYSHKTHTFSDIWIMTKRNLLRYARMPQLIIFSFIQPVMFVLLFAYVFGGAIQTPGNDYINFLLPGILVQTVLFGSMMTGVSLAEDITKGMIDRFRSLPMARSAVLAGRTITESIRNVLIIAVMTLVGMLIGFEITNGFGNYLLAVLLTVGFGFAFSWVSATIGLAVKSVETAQTAGFIWVFPLAFASSIFVPVETMSGAVKWFAEHNPISYTVNTVRALTLGTPVGDNHWYAIAWIVGILIVFIPLAVNRYRKIA
ncbi:MAG: ABC transporter permease [Candidatus Pacebacteria bacterium]|nr:ABC transporter permease [Candidatus Paceibacterota bacterium]MBP9852217.1 ABC transporter permease [Candidatus Paceibacterota bacterium]